MRISDAASIQKSVFDSCFVTEGHDVQQIVSWLEELRDTDRFRVERIPINDLSDWYFDKNTGNLVHASGRFFSIQAIRATAKRPQPLDLHQPIIVQPEIGVLGILTKEVNGVRHVLVQAKNEPGNTNGAQISPTLQATRSNYTQVHEGSVPGYLDFFLGGLLSPPLADQLQSEQGRYFFRKRNRNLVVDVESEVPLDRRYRWISVGQLKKLISFDNLVNMDARSVLSCLESYDRIEDHIAKRLNKNQSDLSAYSRDLLLSLVARDRAAFTMNELLSWLTELKFECDLHVSLEHLSALCSWRIHKDMISQDDNSSPFSVVAVAVQAEEREVASWTQPLIAIHHHGLVGFAVKRIGGILHFLVQARAEPGYVDGVELCPTLVCYGSQDRMHAGSKSHFLDIFSGAQRRQIRFSSLLSEEGGRFYSVQNRYMIVELDDDQVIDLPKNYIWMTYGQMQQLLAHSLCLSIEARTLLSCLSFG